MPSLRDIAKVTGPLVSDGSPDSIKNNAYLIWQSARNEAERLGAQRISHAEGGDGHRYEASLWSRFVSLWPELTYYDKEQQDAFTSPIYSYLRQTHNAHCLNQHSRPPVWWIADTWHAAETPVIKRVVASRREVQLTPAEAGEDREPAPVTVITPPVASAPDTGSVPAGSIPRLTERIVALLAEYDEPLVRDEIQYSLPTRHYLASILKSMCDNGLIYGRREVREERSFRGGSELPGAGQPAMLYSTRNPVPDRTTRELVPGFVWTAVTPDIAATDFQQEMFRERRAEVERITLDAVRERPGIASTQLIALTGYSLKTARTMLTDLARRKLIVVEFGGSRMPRQIFPGPALTTVTEESPMPETTTRPPEFGQHAVKAAAAHAKAALDKRGKSIASTDLRNRLKVGSFTWTWVLRLAEADNMFVVDRSRGPRQIRLAPLQPGQEAPAVQVYPGRDSQGEMPRVKDLAERIYSEILKDGELDHPTLSHRLLGGENKSLMSEIARATRLLDRQGRIARYMKPGFNRRMFVSLPKDEPHGMPEKRERVPRTEIMPPPVIMPFSDGHTGDTTQPQQALAPSVRSLEAIIADALREIVQGEVATAVASERAENERLRARIKRITSALSGDE